MVLCASTGCSRPSEKPAPAPGAATQARRSTEGEWSCPGPAGVVRRSANGTLDIWLKTGAAPRSTTVSASDLRSAVVTDDTMYWADPAGVHRSALDGSAASLVWATADVFAIAASGGHLVAADGEGDLFAIGDGGTRRQVATGLQSDTDSLAASGARAYVVTSQVRGPGGEGDPSLVWAVDLVGSTPPQELLRADSITGFCAGPGGEVVWLELGRPASPGGARRARLMSDGPVLRRSRPPG